MNSRRNLNPDSLAVFGTFGNTGNRSLVETAIARSRPSLTNGMTPTAGANVPRRGRRDDRPIAPAPL
jgi:hypothetical protein